MNTAEQILVVFLSAALLIFLILAITAAVIVVRILKRVDSVTTKVERVVDSAEAAGDTLRQVLVNMNAVQLARTVFSMFMQKGQKKNRNDDGGDYL